MTLDARLGFSGSPRMGAEVVMGDPGGLATSLRVRWAGAGPGALYMNVAARTMLDPATKARVMG